MPRMSDKKHYFLTATEFYNPTREEFMGKFVGIPMKAYDTTLMSITIFDSVQHPIRPVRISMNLLARDWSNYER